MLCAALAVSPWCDARAADTPRVCVLPFSSRDGSGECSWQSVALADLFTHTFSAVPGLHLIERDRLDAILDEIGFSCSGLVEPRRAAQAGKLAKVDYVVCGSYLVQNDVLAVEAHVVEVKSGQLAAGDLFHKPNAELLKWIPAATESLLAQMKTAVDPDWLRKMSKLPVRSYDALEALYTGLIALEANRDRGHAALQSFLRASSVDAGCGRALYWAGKVFEDLGQPYHAAAQYARLGRAVDLAQIGTPRLMEASERLIDYGLFEQHLDLVRAMFEQGVSDKRVLQCAAMYHGRLPTGLNIVNDVPEETNAVFTVTGENAAPAVTRPVRAWDGHCLFAAPPGRLIVGVDRRSKQENPWRAVPVQGMCRLRTGYFGMSKMHDAWNGGRGAVTTEVPAPGLTRKVFAYPQSVIMIPREPLAVGDELSFVLAHESKYATVRFETLPRNVDVLLDGGFATRTPGVVFLPAGDYTLDMGTKWLVSYKPALGVWAAWTPTLGRAPTETLSVAAGSSTNLFRDVPICLDKKPENLENLISQKTKATQKVIWHSRRRCVEVGWLPNHDVSVGIFPLPSGGALAVWAVRIESPKGGFQAEVWGARCDGSIEQPRVFPIELAGVETIRELCLFVHDGLYVLAFHAQNGWRYATSPDMTKWTVHAFPAGAEPSGAAPCRVHFNRGGVPFLSFGTDDQWTWTAQGFCRGRILLNEADDSNRPASLLAAYSRGAESFAILRSASGDAWLAVEENWPVFIPKRKLHPHIAHAGDVGWAGLRSGGCAIVRDARGELRLTNGFVQWRLADFHDLKAGTPKAMPLAEGWEASNYFQSLQAAGAKNEQFYIKHVGVAPASDGVVYRAIIGQYAYSPIPDLSHTPFVAVGVAKDVGREP